MKETIDLIYNKIIGALPPLKEAHAEIYRLQVLVLLRIIAAAGIKRVLATPDEIDQLLAVGRSLGHNVDDLLLLVKPSTYKNWLRRKKGNEVIKRPGRKNYFAGDYTTCSQAGQGELRLGDLPHSGRTQGVGRWYCPRDHL